MRRATRHRLTLLALAVMLLLPATAAGAATPSPKRTLGVYVDPWHVGEWRSAGIRPNYVGRFEAFSRGASVDSFLRESERQALGSVLVTWEPWKPVPAELGVAEQLRPQPGYTNAEIAAGAQDAYILAFARSLATFKGRVYLRYAHEMNGTWYPWSNDPIAYRRAWRHVVRLFASVGASNVSFVWSPNPNLFQSFSAWQRSVRVYWPGSRYVDFVGSTMINFGGVKPYPVKRFVPRLRELRRLYRKPVMLTEVKTVYGGRGRWLRELRKMLRSTPWIRSVAWFQQQSRAAAQVPGVDSMNWDIRVDPTANKLLRGIIRDGRR